MARSELTQWLDAAGRIPRITPAQEIMLARQVQAAQRVPAVDRTAEDERVARRGLKACQRLTDANLRLVWRIVIGTPQRPSAYSRCVPAHVLPDLLQVGAEGVFHAASKFNPEAGYRFSTYAAFWIRERCQKELDTMGRPIRVPTTLTNAARKLPRVRERLLERLGRMPTVEELASALPLTTVETKLLVQRLQPLASLDEVCGIDSDCTLADLVAAPWSFMPPEGLPASPCSHTGQAPRDPPQARRRTATAR